MAIRINTVVNLIMEAEFITTTRGGTALVYQGYKYYKICSGIDGKTFWRCAHSKRCPARATTLDNHVQSTNENHDHPPDHIQIKDQQLKEMKTRLESGECSLAEYISAVGHFTGLQSLVMCIL